MSEEQILGKLDEILGLIKAGQKPTKAEEIKEEFIEYMMKNFNISWVDDDVEKDVYEGVFAILSKLIDKLL
jgi:hypothetical protein